MTQTVEIPKDKSSYSLEDAKAKSKDVLLALSGLFVGLFVVLTASSIVSTSMPVIIAELKGSQTDYTWIITASLLTMAISVPIWSKLGDFVNRKLLLQIALVLFVISAVSAGFAQNAAWLLVFRALEGVSMGGLLAMSQVVIADLVSPRERGKISGIMGAIMLVSQLGSPILGGWLTDSFGWRWNFWVVAPFTIISLILLQANLHLPNHAHKAKLDFLGAFLIILGVGGLLIWISLGGKSAKSGGFAWDSPVSLVLGIGSAITLLGVVLWELFGAQEPILPLRLFKERTFSLATIASIPLGIAQFGAAVFLAQYMQLSRGYSPTESGLMIFPMIIGSLLASIILGQVISRTGVWKRYVVGGTVLFTIGGLLLGTIHYNSNMVLVGCYMFILGVGLGASMQNLTLVTQNSLSASNLSSGTGALTFMRTLGGAAGITILGTILAGALPNQVTTGMSKLVGSTKEAQVQFFTANPTCTSSLETLKNGAIPEVSKLCAPVAKVIENAYGSNIAILFTFMALAAIASIIAVIFLPNKPLGRKTAIEQIEEELGGMADALESEGDYIERTGSIKLVNSEPQNAPKDSIK